MTDRAVLSQLLRPPLGIELVSSQALLVGFIPLAAAPAVRAWSVGVLLMFGALGAGVARVT
ncbi:hypothetical protein A5671_07650 [Mycolicibacter heraklionensis]|nr:hypothetical protein A5671_07650 [Mycolicibacter heraklionensis]